MTRLHLLGPAAAALVAAAMGCGYPSFEFGGIGGGATTSTTISTGSSTTTSDTTSTTSGPPPCPDHLVISEFRTRGPDGGDDDFVELYNPTGQAIVLDSSWGLVYQKTDGTDLIGTIRWTGSNGVIPAHGYYLVAGSTYYNDFEVPDRDGALMSGISDSGVIVLAHNFGTVDAVCYYNSSVQLVGLAFHPDCVGMPVLNPHDDTTGTNSDWSLARTPRDCTDTDHSDVDFTPTMPSTPQDSASPPHPY